MKTSNYLKASLTFLVTTIFVLGAMEMLKKRDLKTCESRQSFRCPRFTCPTSSVNSNSDTDKPPCGSRPWICPNHMNTCSGQEICIGYCKKDEKNCYD